MSWNSKFDLNEDFKKYLLKLVNETLDVIENYKYEKRDYSNDKVIYMRNLKNLETGLFEGLQTKYKMQQYNIKEQTKLRKGTKSYLEKHYNSDGMLTDIFDYIDNDLDVHFVAHYYNGKRCLLGFDYSRDKFYGTYTYVSFGDENNYEEYMVRGPEIISEIIYKRYTKTTSGAYDYLYIMYTFKGENPLGEIEIGEFKFGEKITFNKEVIYNKFDEMFGKYEGKEDKILDSPYIVERK